MLPLLIVLSVVVVAAGAFVLLSGGDSDDDPESPAAASFDDPEAAARAYYNARYAADCQGMVAASSREQLGGRAPEEAVRECEGEGNSSSIREVVATAIVSEGEGTAVVAVDSAGEDGLGPLSIEAEVVEEPDGWKWNGALEDDSGDVGGDDATTDPPPSGPDDRAEECRDQPPHPDFDDPEVQYQACLNGEI